MDFNKLKDVYGKMRDAKAQHDDLSSKYKSNLSAVPLFDSGISGKGPQASSHGESTSLSG